MPSQFEESGFVRVAAAATKVQVSNCEFNSDAILTVMKRAGKEQVRVLVFPELCITAYTCGDLFQQETLRRGALKALAKIVAKSAEIFTGVVVVSLPLALDDNLFNCAVAICRGEILGVVPKAHIPNYSEFYEARWFAPASAARSQQIELCGQSVPFGTDLLFRASDCEDVVIGVETCEDLWVTLPPSSLQALAGATILLNDSASNELVAKADYRRSLVAGQSARCNAAYVYASCGNGESTTDVVFSNHCLIAENGSVLSESERFSDEDVLLINDIDLQRIKHDRLRSNSLTENQRRSALLLDFRPVTFTLNGGAAPIVDKLERFVNAHPFVPSDAQQLDERCREIFNIQTRGFKKRLENLMYYTGKTAKVNIGVSGGLDSTLALLTTCKAFDQLGLPRTNIHGLTMPGFGTGSASKSNADALMKQLRISSKTVDIKALCFEQMRAAGHQPFGINLQNLTLKQFLKQLATLPAGSEDLPFENIQARMRTKILMDSGFVVGTGDLSELALGWCTYNGDHMSMYNPNVGAPKTMVKFEVQWAAQNEFSDYARETLLNVVAQQYSPELLPVAADGSVNQTTEDVIGPYELHDFFVYNLLRFGMTPSKILYLAQHASGFSRNYSETELRHWLKVFLRRFFNAQFKRSALPDGPKIGSISLSPRGDWRMPTDAHMNLWLEWTDAKVV